MLPPSLSPLGSCCCHCLWTRHMLSQLSFQQKLLVYLQPSNTFLFQLISLPGGNMLFAARVSLALHGCVLPNETGPCLLTAVPRSSFSRNKEQFDSLGYQATGCWLVYKSVTNQMRIKSSAWVQLDELFL